MRPEWKLGECVGTYYRPNFENIMYPYIPPHIARPKEIRNLYMIVLPEKCYFSVPKNYKLIAVPLFEIYDHIQRYGPLIASVPQMLSRFRFILSGSHDVGMNGDMMSVGQHQEEHTSGDGGQKEEEKQQQHGKTQDGGLTISLEKQAGEEEKPVTQRDDFVVDFDM